MRATYPEDQLFEWYGRIYADNSSYSMRCSHVCRSSARRDPHGITSLSSIVHENYRSITGRSICVLYLWAGRECAPAPIGRDSGWLLLGGFLASALSAFPPRAALLLPIAPALATLSALGLTAGVDVLSSVIGSVPERIKSYGLIGATLVLALLGLRAYFIEMPQRFSPDLDNAVFWEAQTLKPGADLTLVQPDGVPDNYIPWGMQQFDLGVNYHLIKKADVPITDWNGLCPSGECRFVYVSADRDSVYPYLAQTYGERVPAEVRGADGAVQLYVYAR
jgi:hypothetical protein